MIQYLRRNFPALRFEAGLAENMSHWAQPASTDLIVSSLPWTVFSNDTQEKTIAAILSTLKPGGVFLTYICANALLYPQAKNFVNRLKKGFTTVERRPLEWRNIPPAFVYKSTKAR
jgi:phospholipid N-methyltransferase